MNNFLLSLCKKALIIGKKVTLKDCHYDDKWKNRNQVAPYYNFLYGFVIASKIKDILEIGTYYGGSAEAMWQGLYEFHKGCDLNFQVITVDIKKQICATYENMYINYIIGDSLDINIAEKIKKSFSGFNKYNIDLLYIDSVHNQDHVMNNLKLYGTLFHPKYVILDDIFINDSMKELWEKLSERYESVNLSDMVKRSCGFGIIKCR